MTEQLFHFARIEDAPDWLRLGWIARDWLDGTHHGQWSVAMEWLCSCPMARPETDLNAVLRKFVEEREIREHNAAAIRLASDQSAWRDTVEEGGW